MSYAKKCDRCGTFYEEKVTPDLSIKRYVHPQYETRYDLCDKCTASLELFLKGRSLIGEKTEYEKK